MDGVKSLGDIILENIESTLGKEKSIILIKDILSEIDNSPDERLKSILRAKLSELVG